MVKKLFYVSMVCACSYFIYCYVNPNNITNKATITPTILLSVDGFSNHYLQQYTPKNIIKLAQEGVKAKALLPVFPSKTFPTHISMVTGNYPINHGVIHNKFYNRALDKNYKLGLGKEDPKWLLSETLWSIAEKNNLKTAIYFWPESEVNTLKYKPSYLKPYLHSTPNKQRFDQIIKWLTLPIEERPTLILGYFSTIDSAGHDYGTKSKELKTAIEDFDLLLGEFITDLKQTVGDEVNIVLVSDHGMVDISPKSIRYADLFKDINVISDIRIVDGQTQLYIYLPETEQNKEEQLVNIVKSRLTENEQAFVNVYHFDDYPEHWHFNRRTTVIPNLILEALPPYIFGEPRENSKATHGYDVKLNSALDAIFIANGPDFKQNFEVEPFENIYVFPMILSLLGLEPPENVDAVNNILLPVLTHKEIHK